MYKNKKTSQMSFLNSLIMKNTSSGRSRFCLTGSGINDFSAFALENPKCRPQKTPFAFFPANGV